jgi:tape measure domain-containing protein
LAGIGGVAGGFGLGLRLAADAEQAEAAFSTLLRSRDAARTLLSDLEGFAASTPFQLPELRNAARSLVAFGIPQQQVLQTMRAIGDVAAGTNQRIGDLAEIYGKARVQGRLFQEDINQLTGRGIPIITLLARQFGVAESEVRGLVSEGRVGFPAIEQAFRQMTGAGGQFSGMMEKQSRTASGLVSTLRDNLGQELKSWGEGLMRGLEVRRRLEQTIGLIQRYGPALRESAAAGVEFAQAHLETARNLVYLTAGVVGVTKAYAASRAAVLGSAAAYRVLVASMNATAASQALLLVRTRGIIGVMILARGAALRLAAASWALISSWGALALAVGSVAAVFIKARVEGISYSEAALRITDSLRQMIGMQERASLTLERAYSNAYRSARELGLARDQLRDARGLQAQAEAQQEVNRALRLHLDNLREQQRIESEQDINNTAGSERIMQRLRGQLAAGQARIEQIREHQQATRQQAQQKRATADASREQARQLRQTVQSMIDEVEALGRSESYLRRQRLERLGATATTIRHAQAMGQLVESYRALSSITDPIDRFNQALHLLNRQLLSIPGRPGNIGYAEYAERVAEARQALHAALAGDGADDPVAAFDGQVQRLRQLYRNGHVDHAQFVAAISSQQNRLRQALQLTDSADALQQARDRIAQLRAAYSRGAIDGPTARRLQEQARQTLLGALGITETQSPLQRYETRLTALNNALGIGAINWAEYGRQVRAAKQQLQGVNDTSRERFTLTAAGGADAQLARLDAAAEARAQRGGGIDRRLGRLPDLAAQQLEQNRQQVSVLRRMETNQLRPLAEVEL